MQVTKENVTVDKVVSLLNHEDQKQAHRSTRQISTKMGLIQCSIVQIIHRDFGWKCFSSSNTLVAYCCCFFLHLYFTRSSPIRPDSREISALYKLALYLLTIA